MNHMPNYIENTPFYENVKNIEFFLIANYWHKSGDPVKY